MSLYEGWKTMSKWILVCQRRLKIERDALRICDESIWGRKNNVKVDSGLPEEIEDWAWCTKDLWWVYMREEKQCQSGFWFARGDWRLSVMHKGSVMSLYEGGKTMSKWILVCQRRLKIERDALRICDESIWGRKNNVKVDSGLPEEIEDWAWCTKDLWWVYMREEKQCQSGFWFARGDWAWCTKDLWCPLLFFTSILFWPFYG